MAVSKKSVVHLLPKDAAFGLFELFFDEMALVGADLAHDIYRVLMGINFSRLLTLKYGNSISNYLGNKYTVVSVGRVMTCVLGMVVRREREIREFVKTPFYRVIESVNVDGHTFTGEWRAVKGSAYFESPKLYKENGFKEKEEAKKLIAVLKEGTSPLTCRIVSIEKKKEKKEKKYGIVR